MDNQLVWRLSNASLSAQSAPSPSLITLTYLPNQAPSASLLTLPYPPNQSHLPHSSTAPICPISPICLTPHPHLSAQSAPSASLITLPYPPNQPHLPHSSPSPIPKTSKGFSKTYHFVVSLHNSLHIKSYLIVDLKNDYFCNYQTISIL